jgi:hypothetical protein
MVERTISGYCPFNRNIDDKPGDAEEPVKLNELDELVGLVVVEMNRFHAHPQVSCLRLNYPCKNLLYFLGFKNYTNMYIFIRCVLVGYSFTVLPYY